MPNIEVADRSSRSRLDSVAEAFHYPVARAAAHYYAGYEHETAHFLRMIMRHCKPESVVADLGCGRSDFTTPWKQFCRLVIGVDVSPALAQNRWVSHKVHGDLYHVPLADNSVDVVILRYVLEHVERPVAAFREARRVLRPGGKLLILTPNRRHYVCLVARFTPHWFHRWFLARRGRFDSDVSPTLYRANTPSRLREVARQAGLRVYELELREGVPAYLEWSWLSFMLGTLYERTVNRFEALAGLRVHMLAALEKD